MSSGEGLGQLPIKGNRPCQSELNFGARNRRFDMIDQGVG